MTMQPDEVWHLKTSHLGSRVLVYNVLASTNSLAAELASDQASAGIVILAREQTAGRGQHGRAWLCPANSSVLMSVLVWVPPELRRPVILAAWAANAVCETIQQSIGVEATIKWPNDVLIHGRKVCGILIESRAQPTEREVGKIAVIVGLGVNVSQERATFEAAGLPQAASLAMFTDCKLDWATLARTLIEQLDRSYSALLRGELLALEDCWRRRVALLGQLVVLESQEGDLLGHLHEMTFAGVELDLMDGTRVQMVPEKIKHIHLASL